MPMSKGLPTPRSPVSVERDKCNQNKVVICGNNGLKAPARSVALHENLDFKGLAR